MVKKLQKDYDIAYDFALKVYKKFNKLIKSIALFGSVPKQTAKKQSDIDIIVIIDNCSVDWDQELIAWYREELGKIVARQKYPKEIHINTVTLGAFLQEVMSGDPVATNVLRYGQVLIDFGGFFEPLKVLLARGKIKPTAESVYTSLRRAPVHLSRSRFNVLSAIEGLYWAMVDSAHAALMAAGKTPPSPEHVPDMLIKTRGIRLGRKYINWYVTMYDLSKSVTHGNITRIAGKKIDYYDKIANMFVDKMTDITDILLKNKKIIKLKKT
ncbi:hypothetical protein CL621_00655 [archaeon]|nr:hypothetical protein [archaeon]